MALRPSRWGEGKGQACCHIFLSRLCSRPSDPAAYQGAPSFVTAGMKKQTQSFPFQVGAQHCC